jgi:hypothetical protein
VKDLDCCHPSEFAGEGDDSYLCPNCGTVWTRYPFAEAPEALQRTFRRHPNVGRPTSFWSTRHRDNVMTELAAPVSP